MGEGRTLPVDYGALSSLGSVPNNLPQLLTSFVGRERELGQLREAFGETRLLTLTGAGGCGKTRLALQTVADGLGHYPDGAWWVDLAPLAEAELLGDTLAAALGVRPLPGMTALQAVAPISPRAGPWSCSTIASICSRRRGGRPKPCSRAVLI